VIVRVYGITSGADAPVVPGVRLIAVRVGRLTALVSPARGKSSVTERSLREYHRRVAAIADRLPAFLPARFGSTVDDNELVVILRSRSAAIAQALADVRGRVQMTLRITGVPTSDPRRVGRRKAHTGAEYLRRLATEAAARHEIPGLAPVRGAVTRWVCDERVDVRNGVGTVYHLVARRSVPAYVRAVNAAVADGTIRLVMSGPFPPYAFAAL
jgi:hypothetical protein